MEVSGQENKWSLYSPRSLLAGALLPTTPVLLSFSAKLKKSPTQTQPEGSLIVASPLQAEGPAWNGAWESRANLGPPPHFSAAQRAFHSLWRAGKTLGQHFGLLSGTQCYWSSSSWLPKSCPSLPSAPCCTRSPWQPENGHRGSIYTVGKSKYYQAGLLAGPRASFQHILVDPDKALCSPITGSLAILKMHLVPVSEMELGTSGMEQNSCKENAIAHSHPLPPRAFGNPVRGFQGWERLP